MNESQKDYTPTVVVQQDDYTRFGLHWDDHCVVILRQTLKPAVVTDTSVAQPAWGEWEPHKAAYIPPGIAALVSGFAAQQRADEAWWNALEPGAIKVPLVGECS